MRVVAVHRFVVDDFLLFFLRLHLEFNDLVLLRVELDSFLSHVGRGSSDDLEAVVLFARLCYILFARIILLVARIDKLFQGLVARAFSDNGRAWLLHYRLSHSLRF